MPNRSDLSQAVGVVGGEAGGCGPLIQAAVHDGCTEEPVALVAPARHLYGCRVPRGCFVLQEVGVESASVVAPGNDRNWLVRVAIDAHDDGPVRSLEWVCVRAVIGPVFGLWYEAIVGSDVDVQGQQLGGG